MGLWNSILQKLTGGNAEARTRTVRSSRSVDSTDVGGVATLELPKNTGQKPEEAAVPPWWAPTEASLLEPVEMPRPDLTTEARALENLLVSHFDGHDLTLPPLLNVAEKVLRRIHDPKCKMADVARELEADQVMAAAVLRMANSPLYRGLHKIAALIAAVNRLGTVAIRTLMVRESMRAAMFGRKGAVDPYARLIWRRSLASAFVMRRLSAFTDLREDDAYLLGLLHDIGNVIVLRIMQSQEMVIRRSIDLPTFDYLCHECHQEFGELIGDEWKLPHNVKLIITDHHTYPSDDHPVRTARIQILLADMITAMLGYAPQASYDLMESRPVHYLGLAGREDFMTCLTALPDELEEMLDAG